MAAIIYQKICICKVDVVGSKAVFSLCEIVIYKKQEDLCYETSDRKYTLIL